MHRILQKKHSGESMASSSLTNMWNTGSKLQTLGLTVPVIYQQTHGIINSQPQHCMCPHRNVTNSRYHTRHSSTHIRYLMSGVLPKAYAQEKQTADVGKPVSPDSKDIEGKEVSYKVTDEEVHACIMKQTGMDRIRLLFGSFEELYGKQEHPSLAMYKSQVTFIFLLTFPMYAYGASQRASERFKSRAVILKYDTKFLARRAHLDSMIFAGLRSGMRWSLKIGVTVALMLGISQLISVYRNKSGIVDIVSGAGLGFGIVSLRTGPKAFVGGTVLGAVVGFFPAVLMFQLKKWTSSTQEEEHFKFMHDLLERKKMLEYQALEETDVITPKSNVDSKKSQPALETSDTLNKRTA